MCNFMQFYAPFSAFNSCLVRRSDIPISIFPGLFPDCSKNNIFPRPLKFPDFFQFSLTWRNPDAQNICKESIISLNDTSTVPYKAHQGLSWRPNDLFTYFLTYLTNNYQEVESDLPMVSGSRSRMFIDRWRSVRLTRSPISSGKSSSLFSDTSSWFNCFRLPIVWNHRQSGK